MMKAAFAAVRPKRARSGTTLEKCIAQPSADREDAPPRNIPHIWHFAQALDHRIIVHHNRRLLPTDHGNSLAQALREIKSAALPITGKVLTARLDQTILVYAARTTYHDQGRQIEIGLPRASEKSFEHTDEFIDGFLPARHLLAMSPPLAFPYRGFLQRIVV